MASPSRHASRVCVRPHTGVLHGYTCAQVLEDGASIDVTETAREAGFRVPVAATAALWTDIGAIPPSKRGIQDVAGRLWDVLWMARLAARQGGSEAVYRLTMHVGRTSHYQVKLVSGPGDHGEHVLTLMRPDED